MTSDASLWERSRRAAYSEITEVAMRLFLEQGFAETTVDQIAAQAGISRRSFFRYFGTKEDIVLGGLAQDGVRMRGALEEIPLSVAPWAALRQALDAVEALEEDPDVTLKISTMMYETPSLRARSVEKHLHWQSLLVPNISERLEGEPDRRRLAATAIVASAIACLDVAGERWTVERGAIPLADLYDQAVNAVRSQTA